jgi:hypothetical protein
VTKNKLFRLAYWAGVMDSKPTLLSNTAPVRDTYCANASEAIRMRVVPVSTMPALRGRIVLVP